MLKVAVLGAGYMGSAITFPLAANGLQVNLWGTWLDDEIISTSLNGNHPKLKKPLLPEVRLFYSTDLRAAVKDTDIIFIGIASEGFIEIFKMMLDNLDKNCYFFKLTKGLVEYNGKIMRATEAASDIFSLKMPGEKFLWTTVGGPVRALDLAYQTPSASVYGIADGSIKELIGHISTDYYRIFPTDDVPGAEISATFKNIYSITSGICDGLFKTKKEGLYYNIVAFLFNQSVLEMATIVQEAGGRKETVFDLAGVGDLHVTSAAGRNRRYGEMVGRGVDPEDAFKMMFDEGEYGEGYIALRLAIPWLKNNFPALIKKLPLLVFLHNTIFMRSDPVEGLKELILKLGF